MVNKLSVRWSLIALSLIVISSLVLSGCYLLPQEEEELAPPLMQPASIEYRTRPVERGDLILQTRMNGALVPRTQQVLSFERQGGRLKEVHVRLGQRVSEGDLLLELDSEQIESQVLLQEIEVEKAKLNWDQLRANNADRFSIRRAELDLQQQEIRLEGLVKQLEATRIYAPFDGEITYLPSASIGDYINAYQIVVRVADTRELVIVTTSDQAGSLPIGAEVEVEMDNRIFPGTVVANPSTLFNDPDERLHRAAIIDLQDAELPAAVGSGTSVRINYIQERRDDVLVVPRSYINLMSGRRYVNVLEDGIRVEKDVEVGLTTDTEAEIVRGLEEGDLVIIN